MKLSREFRAIGLLLALMLLAANRAGASEVCFPGINLAVPATTEGLYVNLVNGTSGQTEASVPGFDIDIYAAASTSPCPTAPAGKAAAPGKVPLQKAKLARRSAGSRGI